MSAISNALNPLKEVSTYFLFKELKKRKEVECLVIDDDYILKINKKDVNM